MSGFECQPGQARYDRFIAGDSHVLGEEHGDVTVMPGCHPFVSEVGGPLGLPLHQREVTRLAAGQKSEGIERSRDGIEPLGIGRLGHPRRQRPAPLFENTFGLRAIVGSGGAVGAEHRKLHHDLHRPAFARPGQMEIALASLRFGKRQSLAHFRARVLGKRFAADPENRISDDQNAVCGRTGLHPRDRDVTGIGCHECVAVHRAAQARGAEIPVVLGSGDEARTRRCEKEGDCQEKETGFHADEISGETESLVMESVPNSTECS